MPSITPINYNIRLEPDLTNFSFRGRCEFQFEAAEPLAEVALNILDIAVWSCRIRRPDQWINCVFKVDPADEKILVYLPETLSGIVDLAIDYQGTINDKMAGFYRSNYTYQAQSRYIAVTQFEESDARRAFPCIDHPAAKATFDITMDIDPNLAAISNQTIQKEEMLANGKKRVCFEQTPKMSTYLVFFGVGEFEITHDKQDSRVRTVTLPGMKQFAEFGMDFGRKSLAFSEAYYDIAYPLPKMDLIAIPDFAFGAMENWGAITFRENLLLHYPETTSKSGEERICEVIAHEIAHQWFGNLVTPSDWRYLWLNESFATYFGYGVVDHYYPQWETWQQFLYSQTGSAMVRDALQETFAIEIPGGEHVVINASTAPIIYSKGGSILMQVKGYIGEENFQKGLQLFLRTYEYGCAASHHLWEAFEAVSRLPISAVMKSWIEQPGFPIISVERRGNQLVLNQRRFTYLPHDSDQQWLVPISVRLYSATGAARQVSLLMDEKEQVLEIDEDIVAYKANDRQTGFYRVKYDDQKNIDKLGQLVREKSMPPEDRWGLQNDLYALVRCNATGLDDYLDFLGFYDREDAYLPLASMAENLYSAYLVLQEESRQKIRTLAVPKFEEILAAIGYEPRPDENHPTSMLRDQIIWDAALYGSRPVLDFARDRFAALLKGEAIHPDIMKSVMQAGALAGDEQAFDWFDQRLQVSQIEHERLNILSALGCFMDARLIKKSQQYVLDRVPARNKFMPVVAMCANPHAIELMWDWYVSNLEQIEQFHPLLYERVLASIIPTAGIRRADEVMAFFDDYRARTDKAKDVINLSLERLEVNLQMRKAL